MGRYDLKAEPMSIRLQQSSMDALQELSRRTGTPMTVLIRQAVDEMLERREVDAARRRAR